jgi:hypothetical protein
MEFQQAAGSGQKQEFRMSNCGFGNTQKSQQATLKKNPGVRIQNAGGKNIKRVLPFWLLAN